MNTPYSHPPREPSDGQSDAQAPGTSEPTAGANVGQSAAERMASSYGATDARSPLRWYDLLYLALFNLVGGLAITLAVSAVAIGLFDISGAPVLIVSQGLLSAATLAFLYVMIRGRTAAPFWPSVGWRSFRTAMPRGALAVRYVLGGFGLAVVVGILGSYLGEPSRVPLEEMFRSRESVLLLTVLGILVAPIVEETVFRGCIYPVVARKFGIPVGVVATGTLFGLAHAQQLGGAWGQIGLLIGVGIVLTYVRARAGTVMASYLVHLGYNTILFVGFYLATGGLRNLPGS